jgi:uncharacterized membrane protein
MRDPDTVTQMENDMNADPGSSGSPGAAKDPQLGNKILAVALVVMVVAVAVMAVALSSPTAEKLDKSQAMNVNDANITTVTIPLSEISQTATWYEYNVSNVMVRFFAVRDANGVIHTAFDECPLCYDVHMGFSQNGSDMWENCCDMAFPISEITAEGTNFAGCHPIWLNSTIVGDQLAVKKTDLAKQRLIFLQKDEGAEVSAYDATHVAIPLSGISTSATWYQYAANGTTLRFFAVMEENGTVHTAFDICTKCYKAHLGFRQEPISMTMMTENCCNMVFPIANITAAGCSSSACHPTFLPSTVIGDQVVMSLQDFNDKAYLFKV